MKTLDRTMHGDGTDRGPLREPPHPFRPPPVFDPERRKLWLADRDRARASRTANAEGLIRCHELPGLSWATAREAVESLGLDALPGSVTASVRDGVSVCSRLHFYRDGVPVAAIRVVKARSIVDVTTGTEYRSIAAALLAVSGLSSRGGKAYRTAHQRIVRSARDVRGVTEAYGRRWRWATDAATAQAAA